MAYVTRIRIIDSGRRAATYAKGDTLELTTPRFAMLPVFLLAASFSIMAPLYWTHVEAPSAGAGGTVREDQEIYGRILPAIHYGTTRATAGEWPLWAAGQYCGVPFFANPNHGVLQPLNWVFYLAPGVRGLALHAFLGLFFMALFFSLYLRALGAAYIPAAMGGMVYAFCGATAAVMSRPEMLGVLAWAPLLYWTVYEYSCTPRWSLVIAGGAILTAIVLAGSPMLGVFMSGSALVYGAARVLFAGGGTIRARWRPLRGLAAMAGLGALYSAVQWVPSVAWLMSLETPGTALWPQAWPGHLPGTFREVPAGVLAPRDTTLPGMLYFGVISLMVIPAALLHRNRRFETGFFLLAASLGLAIAVWGSTGAPGADHWKVFIFPAAAAAAALVGLGADRLLLTGRDPRSPLIWGAVLLALVAAVVLLLAGTAGTRGPVVLAVLVLLPFFIMRVRWLGVVSGLGLALFHFVDLQQASANMYLHPYSGDQHWLQDSLPAIKEAEAQALGQRILTLPPSRETALPGNIGLMQPVYCAGGAYWPLDEDQAAWWSKLAPYLTESSARERAAEKDSGPNYTALLNLMAVRVIVGERNLAWMEQSGEALRLRYLTAIGQLRLWKNESALPRIRWVPNWEPVGGTEDAMAALLAPDFPVETTCVVARSGGAAERLAALLPAGAPEDASDLAERGTAQLVRESPEELEIAVKADVAGLLVVADSYDRGWKALLDGKSAPVYQVNGLFRGVFVPPGEHRVVFAYAPVSVTIGLLITGVGVLGTAGWCLFRLATYLRGFFGRKNLAQGEPSTPNNIEEV